MADEIDCDFLIATALLGLDDLTLAELRMKDRLAGFISDREHRGSGWRRRCRELVTESARRPGAERAPTAQAAQEMVGIG